MIESYSEEARAMKLAEATINLLKDALHIAGILQRYTCPERKAIRRKVYEYLAQNETDDDDEVTYESA